MIRARVWRRRTGSAERRVGLGNVDARLRQVYGDGYGLVVETAPQGRHQGELPGAEVRAGRARRADG